MHTFSSFFFIRPWFICCFLVLGYLSESEQEKIAEYLTVHLCTTSECTISGTDEEDTHAHTDTQSLAHEENQNVECLSMSKLSIEHFNSLSVFCTREGGRGHCTKPSMQYAMIITEGFLDIGWYGPNMLLLLCSCEECYCTVMWKTNAKLFLKPFAVFCDKYLFSLQVNSCLIEYHDPILTFKICYMIDMYTCQFH